jgi:hypothetical protein
MLEKTYEHAVSKKKSVFSIVPCDNPTPFCEAMVQAIDELCLSIELYKKSVTIVDKTLDDLLNKSCEFTKPCRLFEQIPRLNTQCHCFYNAITDAIQMPLRTYSSLERLSQTEITFCLMSMATRRIAFMRGNDMLINNDILLEAGAILCDLAIALPIIGVLFTRDNRCRDGKSEVDLYLRLAKISENEPSLRDFINRCFCACANNNNNQQIHMWLGDILHVGSEDS